MDKNIKTTTIGTLHNDLFFNRKVSISFDVLNYDKTADYKVLVQIEPPTILNILNQIIQNKNNFDLILCWHPLILKECENSELFPFGSCWINSSDRYVHSKNKKISIISSNKRQTVGHRLRHEIINNKLIDLDIFGHGYNPIDNKIIGLKNYMFSIIIENDNTDNWFTEKLIDSLSTGTVPIYWGCSNICKFFNTKGFIQFNDINEFKDIIPKLTRETYDKMLPFINENFNKSFEYGDFWGRIENKIKSKLI